MTPSRATSGITCTSQKTGLRGSPDACRAGRVLMKRIAEAPEAPAATAAAGAGSTSKDIGSVRAVA